MAWNPSHLAKALALVREMARREVPEAPGPLLSQDLETLEGLLLAAWEEVLELNLELVKLRGVNLKYKQQLRLGRELFYDGRVYWFRTPGLDKPDGPLCPTCWEAEDKAVHLHRVIHPDEKARPHGDWQEWECKRCREVFLRPASVPEPGEP